MQTYMAYLGLGDYPALFTALNKDTGEIYAELVPYVPAVAQRASDKGVMGISSASPEDLPRVSAGRNDFRRPEERSVGTESGSTCRSRWSQHHLKKKNT